MTKRYKKKQRKELMGQGRDEMLLGNRNPRNSLETYTTKETLEKSELRDFYLNLMKGYGSNFNQINSCKYLNPLEFGPEATQFLWMHNKEQFVLGLPQRIIPSQLSCASILARVDFDTDYDLDKIKEGIDNLIGTRNFVENKGYKMNWEMDSPTCTFKGKCSHYLPVTSRAQIVDLVKKLN